MEVAATQSIVSNVLVVGVDEALASNLLVVLCFSLELCSQPNGDYSKAWVSFEVDSQRLPKFETEDIMQVDVVEW